MDTRSVPTTRRSLASADPAGWDSAVADRRTDRPPALLADASWYGTLAAARNLGAHGVSVVLARDTLVAPARWSRHVDRTVSCPQPKNSARFLDWLLRFGSAEPGHVLYPTSDDVAWIVAAHAAELSRWFRLYAPPLDSLMALLDKARMEADARAAGLDTPETCVAEDETEVERAGRELGFPLYVKPRAQVAALRLGKGTRVENPRELLQAWRSQRASGQSNVEASHQAPSLALPMIQTYCAAAERIYTVDGFVDHASGLYASLACVKLLQRPRGSGAGIIFEHAEVDPLVDQGLRRLFQANGFRGVFDAEFVESGGRKLLIDINPRFYNHMAFEVERGLPLPWLAYLGAIGDREGLQRAVNASSLAPSGPRAYVHRFPTALMLGIQPMTRAMNVEDRRRWRSWLDEYRASSIDPVHEAGDRGPGLAELALELASALRHPRAYLRSLASSVS